MAAVETLGASRPAIEAATRLGYGYSPYQADLEHWFCRPSFAFRTHHLHLVPVGTPHWRRSLAFRDYLRAHAGVAAEYEILKRRLAREHRFDREAYTLAKGPFIGRITDMALELGVGGGGRRRWRAAAGTSGFGGYTALFCTVVSQPNFWLNYQHRGPFVAPFAELLLEHGADPNIRASLWKQVRLPAARASARQRCSARLLRASVPAE